MHTPITTLKSAARQGEQVTTVVDVVRKIFNLHTDAAEVPVKEAPVEKQSVEMASTAKQNQNLHS
jgi:hypothetical protein